MHLTPLCIFCLTIWMIRGKPNVPLTKVIIPAVYKEWGEGKSPPRFMHDKQLMEEVNYTTFLYQKLHADQPNFISTNRGCENGVYYQYVVDNYHNFPDLAVFVHAHPEEHNHHWLNMVRCASPNLTYFSLNMRQGFRCRSSWSGTWAKVGIWLEQCIRDTLRLVWDNITVAELNQRVPVNKPIVMCSHCCQQFIVSKAMIHRRSLQTWKELQHLLSVQEVCHVGEPDYENLYAFNGSSRMRLGPESPTLGMGEGKYGKSAGRVTQAVTSEHLAHVIFGHESVQQREPTMDNFCEQFLPQDVCPGSPCIRNSTSIS